MNVMRAEKTATGHETCPKRASLTGVESRVLLHVAELLKPPVAVAALVGLFSGVDADVLHQLVVRTERFEALLALVRLHFAAPGHLPRVDLHGAVSHEDL